jgi:tRNA threonylcarbamoyladenosine biosynthesis protein TsaE
MLKQKIVVAYKESDTQNMAAAIAKQLNPITTRVTIDLQGDLGTGKTAFVRALLHGLGYQGRVKSPTYTFVEPYVLADARQIYHFDLYRLEMPEEIYSLGIEDYFAQADILLIEWPEKAAGLLPKADLTCYIEMNNESRRFKWCA